MTKLSQAFDVITKLYNEIETSTEHIFIFDGRFLFTSKEYHFDRIMEWEIESENLCLNDLIIPAQYCLKEFCDYVNYYKQYTLEGEPLYTLDGYVAYVNSFKSYKSILSEIFGEKYFSDFILEKEVISEDEIANTKDLPLIIY
jgi:hypothetical protein